MGASFGLSGFKWTSVTGVQLRAGPVQRLGFAAQGSRILAAVATLVVLPMHQLFHLGAAFG